MNSLMRVVVSVSVLTMSFSAASAQDSLRRQDSKGPVTVTAALVSPSASDTPLKVRLAFDTHSVDLDSLAFQDIVALRMPDGSDVAPAAVEQAQGRGHHRQAIVSFPPLREGDQVRIVVKNVGGVKERVFTWNHAGGR